VGFGGFAVIEADHLQRAALPIAAQGQFYLAAFAFYLPPNAGDVGFVYHAALELQADMALGGFVAGHEEDARGFHVKAMHEQGFGESGLDAGLERVFAVLAATRDAEQAAGFGQDQQVVIHVDHAEACLGWFIDEFVF
jgi:hypothetical protein